jgi:hypothetical protein
VEVDGVEVVEEGEGSEEDWEGRGVRSAFFLCVGQITDVQESLRDDISRMAVNPGRFLGHLEILEGAIMCEDMNVLFACMSLQMMLLRC